MLFIPWCFCYWSLSLRRKTHSHFTSVGEYFSTSMLIKFLASIKYQCLELLHSSRYYQMELVVVHSFNFLYNKFIFCDNKVICDFCYFFRRTVQNVLNPRPVLNRRYIQLLLPKVVLFLDYAFVVNSNDTKTYLSS